MSSVFSCVCVCCSTALGGVLALAVQLTDIRPVNFLSLLPESPVGAGAGGSGAGGGGGGELAQEAALPVNDAPADRRMAPSGRPAANQVDGGTPRGRSCCLIWLSDP